MNALMSFLQTVFGSAKEPAIGDNVRWRDRVGTVRGFGWSYEYPGQKMLSIDMPGSSITELWPSEECEVTRTPATPRDHDGVRLVHGSRVRLSHRKHPVGRITGFGSRLAGTGKQRKPVAVVHVEIELNGRIEHRTWKRREVTLA